MRGTAVRWRIGLTALASIAGEAGLRAQCAMCRTLLVSPEGQRLAAALRAGIAILLLAPVATFAVVAYAAVRSQRRLEARRGLREDYSPAVGENPRSPHLQQPQS